MDLGNVNATQNLPWWLREATKRTPISLVCTRIWTRNSRNVSPVWWISIVAMLCAFKSFITDRISPSPGAGIRASIFNRCNDAHVRTPKVPLVHTSRDVITLSRTRSCLGFCSTIFQDCLRMFTLSNFRICGICNDGAPEHFTASLRYPRPRYGERCIFYPTS